MNIEIELLRGGELSKYPGCFPKPVENTIRKLVGQNSILHIFSGQSNIGSVRIDIDNKNATINTDVFEFLRTENKHYKWLIADPPYSLKNQSKMGYKIESAPWNSIEKRRIIINFCKKNIDNVLWFDFSSPSFKGFYKKKVWFWFPCSNIFSFVRCLTYLKRQGNQLSNYQ